MKFNLILPFVFYFFNTYPLPVVNQNISLSNNDPGVFLIKQRWHTGIVFSVNKIDSTVWKEAKDFQNFKFVDVGWGDEDFYQHPDFDAGLAVKALFYPTPSTLRVEGFNFNIEKYIEMTDFAAFIPLTESQLIILQEHVSDTYFKNNFTNPEILNERYGGNIKFYRAVGNYHLFNTCNTWIARGLEKAGFEIIPSQIILAEDLFHSISQFGVIIKIKNRDQAVPE